MSIYIHLASDVGRRCPPPRQIIATGQQTEQRPWHKSLIDTSYHVQRITWSDLDRGQVWVVMIIIIIVCTART
jgi:hypothetical protein